MLNNTEKRNILVTSALPYANAPLHLGHILEHTQTDIWVRYQKLIGNNCTYVCADDAHGTPIMLRAEEEGIPPEELVSNVEQEHKKDFSAFAVDFDNYHSTHSEENREISELIYRRLREKGYIERKKIKQAFDPVKKMFLPDRFVKGTCPRCGSQDQYGDSCESCGATYLPTDLVDPVSVVSGATPELRDSDHLFFKLSEFQTFLKTWLSKNGFQQGVVAKLGEWFTAGLQDWDISRDAPYFGFAIPGEKDKYFYVWLDAPIGYFASFKNLCERTGMQFDDFCGHSESTELYHFIGKDIVYFHTLFWPAMLHGSGFRLPTNIFVHGFLTVDGQKMSKSRGTFITAETYLRHLDPNYLRYYFAAKLGSAIEDIDLNLEDFEARVNSDLVGKYVNIASRCAGFITNRFDGMLSTEVDDVELLREFQETGESIAELYEAREYGKVVRQIMALADSANQYIDRKKPWEIAKRGGDDEELHRICSMGVFLFRILCIYLKPILPVAVDDAERFLGVSPLSWQDIFVNPLGARINKFAKLIQRVDKKKVEQMVSDSKENLGKSSGSDAKKEKNLSKLIPIEDFLKIELKVAEIIKAEEVPEADKLLRLIVDLGDSGGEKQVFAGLKQAYSPEDLIGRQVVIVANLKSRKMRFGVSEAMILGAGPGGEEIFLIAPDEGASPGMEVK